VAALDPRDPKSRPTRNDLVDDAVETESRASPIVSRPFARSRRRSAGSREPSSYLRRHSRRVRPRSSGSGAPPNPIGRGERTRAHRPASGRAPHHSRATAPNRTCTRALTLRRNARGVEFRLADSARGLCSVPRQRVLRHTSPPASACRSLPFLCSRSGPFLYNVHLRGRERMNPPIVVSRDQLQRSAFSQATTIDRRFSEPTRRRQNRSLQTRCQRQPTRHPRARTPGHCALDAVQDPLPKPSSSPAGGPESAHILGRHSSRTRSFSRPRSSQSQDGSREEFPAPCPRRSAVL